MGSEIVILELRQELSSKPSSCSDVAAPRVILACKLIGRGADTVKNANTAQVGVQLVVLESGC